MVKVDVKSIEGSKIGLFFLLSSVIIAFAIILSVSAPSTNVYDGVIRTEEGLPAVGNNGVTVASDDFGTRVAMQKLVGFERVTIVGNNIAVPNTPATIWTVGGVYIFPTVARQLNISSTSALDNLTGTGARIIRIQGLDADYNKITEFVSLNGTQIKTTTQNFFRVNGLDVVNAGTRTGAVGTILVTHPLAGAQGQIQPDVNVAQRMIYTVPANHTLFLTNILASTGRNDGVQLTLRSFLFSTGITYSLSQSFLYQGDLVFIPEVPLRFEEKTDINFRGINIGSGSTSRVSMLVNAVLVNNTVLDLYPISQNIWD